MTTDNRLIQLSTEERILWQIRKRLTTLVDEVEAIKSRQVILSNKLDTIIENTTP